MLVQLVQAQDNPIQIDIKAFIVSDSGDFIPTTTAADGQVLEYRVTATNTDPSTLPAGSVTVVGPVPEGLTYIPNSALQTEELTLEYSSDGVTFSPTSLGNVRAVRWTHEEPFEPNEQITVVYRAVVGDTLPSTRPSNSLSSNSGVEQAYTQAMFGHLGVIEVSCPTEVQTQVTPIQTVICGEVGNDFDLFRQAWDVYADYEGEVPVIPTALSAWRSDGNNYSRNYDLNGSEYSVIFTQVAEREGFVVIVYSP
jgi:uncharacterized repeat protein (TIGR01451 family)